ncbi:MAG: hypothetical protein KBF88_07080 [Polyangiaceae bacterium]|nr:hypothetical protein [Polyangiaceae bacterium]
MPPHSVPQPSFDPPPENAPSLRSVRLGTGANCSSIGSMVDTLFLTSIAGTALTAAVLAGFHRPKADPGEPNDPPASLEGTPEDKGENS